MPEAITTREIMITKHAIALTIPEQIICEIYLDLETVSQELFSARIDGNSLETVFFITAS